jgi:hypothetical protein
MRFEAKTLFTLFMVVISAYIVVSAWDWPFGTRLFPMIMGFTALILSLLQFSWELYRSVKGKLTDKREETGDLQIDWRMGSRAVAHRAGNFFAWLFGFFFCIWIFGFFVAVPLYSFFYLKFQAKEGWWLSLTLTLAVFLFFFVLFDQILHLHWFSPLITELLTSGK